MQKINIYSQTGAFIKSVEVKNETDNPEVNVKGLQTGIYLLELVNETEKSWKLSVAEVLEATCDLSVKNPNKPEETPLREPALILEEMQTLDEETNEILGTLNELV